MAMSGVLTVGQWGYPIQGLGSHCGAEEKKPSSMFTSEQARPAQHTRWAARKAWPGAPPSQARDTEPGRLWGTRTARVKVYHPDMAFWPESRMNRRSVTTAYSDLDCAQPGASLSEGRLGTTGHVTASETRNNLKARGSPPTARPGPATRRLLDRAKSHTASGRRPGPCHHISRGFRVTVAAVGGDGRQPEGRQTLQTSTQPAS